jgi:large subunit ribosomal protein L10
MDRDQKAAQIEEMKAEFGEADAIFAIDYRGISVPQAAELRAGLREADATFRIVKNRLAKIALGDSGDGDGLVALLEGPTALTFVKGDPVVAAKAISTFNREHEVLEYKGGVMEGAMLDPDQFTAIARLPALEVLHGQLAGLTASPLTGLVRGLGSMISGLAVALGQIQEQGLVAGEAEQEAPAEKAPAEEAPAEEPAAQAEEPAGGQSGDESQTEEPAAEEPAADEAPAVEAEAGEAAADEPAADAGEGDAPSGKGDEPETETEEESKEDE